MKDVMAWTVRFMTDYTISLRFHDVGTIIYSLLIMYLSNFNINRGEKAFNQMLALKKFIDTYSVTWGKHLLTRKFYNFRELPQLGSE